jgi:phage/plasmid-like protein (TIGR03299 family)
MSHGIMENDGFVSAHGEMPWHGLGAILQGDMDSADALRHAHLDWQVVPVPLYVLSGTGSVVTPSSVNGYVANMREDTQEILGVVSDKYRVIQNVDAFKFADDLLDVKRGEAVYETAGSLFNGRRVFMLLNLPAERILDDEVNKYLCLSNSHDGTGAMKVFTTGVRVVCHNTLSMALSGFEKGVGRGLSIRHMSSADIRRKEAVRAYRMADDYFDGIRKFAEFASGKKVDVDVLLAKLFPEEESWTARRKANNADIRNTIKELCKCKDDLGNHTKDGWGFVNAVADFRSNTKPKRVTSKSADRRMASFMDGDDVVQMAVDLVLAA